MSAHPATTSELAGPARARVGRLRFMHAANVLLSTPLGIVLVVAPETAAELLLLPTMPAPMITFLGVIPLAFGIIGALGLRAPVRFASALLLQIVYKTAFLLAAVLPAALAGSVPTYMLIMTAIFVFFIVGNSVAVPFRHLVGAPRG